MTLNPAPGALLLTPALAADGHCTCRVRSSIQASPTAALVTASEPFGSTNYTFFIGT